MAPRPWDTEPDKAHWIDPATGLDCLIVRGPAGALCGYVGLPPGHPFHGTHYRDLDDVEVHGGLTFSDACDPDGSEAEGICHTPQPGRPDDVWWLGFDCAHYSDCTPGSRLLHAILGGDVTLPIGVYRTYDYVHAEVARLAAQLETQ